MTVGFPLNLVRRPDGTVHPAARGAAWVALAVTLVAGWEGYASKPYIDEIGTGHPETWCFGATAADGSPPPPMSKVFTKAECLSLLQQKLVRIYAPPIEKCINGPIPPHREAALVDAAYNLGAATICRGLVARYLNAGNVKAGCKALLQYVNSAGQFRQGLLNRREDELSYCLRSD